MQLVSGGAGFKTVPVSSGSEKRMPTRHTHQLLSLQWPLLGQSQAQAQLSQHACPFPPAMTDWGSLVQAPPGNWQEKSSQEQGQAPAQPGD